MLEYSTKPSQTGHAPQKKTVSATFFWRMGISTNIWIYDSPDYLSCFGQGAKKEVAAMLPQWRLLTESFVGRHRRLWMLNCIKNDRHQHRCFLLLTRINKWEWLDKICNKLFFNNPTKCTCSMTTYILEIDHIKNVNNLIWIYIPH